MTGLRLLGAVALSSFVAVAALADSGRTGDATDGAPTHRACLRNPSYGFCQTASTDGSHASPFGQRKADRTQAVPAGHSN